MNLRSRVERNTGLNKVSNKRLKVNMDEIKMPDFSGLESNLVESDRHTLIVKNYPAEVVPASDEIGSIPGYFEEVPEMNVFKLFLGDFSDESGHGVHKIINRLQESGANDLLEFHISGHGGYTTEGITLYNVVNAMFREKSTAYLNYGYSMNALAFLFCKERIIYEHSEIMFHTYAGGFGGKSNEILTQVEHTDRHLKQFFGKLLKPYYTTDELQKMMDGKDFWANSTEMLNRGIATGIILDGVYFSREEYFEKHDIKGGIKKSWLNKQAKAERELEKLNAKNEALSAQINAVIEKAQKPTPRKTVKKVVTKTPVKKVTPKKATPKKAPAKKITKEVESD